MCWYIDPPYPLHADRFWSLGRTSCKLTFAIRSTINLSFLRLQVEIRIRLNDTKNGRTTLWSLEKFELMVGRMRDLYQVIQAVG